MAWMPREDTRTAIKFWLDLLQVVSVTGGVLALGFTFYKYRVDQRDHVEAIARELRQPYAVRKLDLYLEAARVVAHLAAAPDVDRQAYEARFWELYWGELAFVESTTGGEGAGGPSPSVERLMVEFCRQAFPGECSRPSVAGAGGGAGADPASAAINLARQASEEIRAEWDRTPR